MVKKKTQDHLNQDILSSLNHTELRMLAEKKAGRFVHPYIPRELLEQYLLGNAELPTTPIDEFRKHMIIIFAENYSAFGPVLACKGNCHLHNDLQVLECQILNDSLRHPRLQALKPPQDTKKEDNRP